MRLLFPIFLCCLLHTSLSAQLRLAGTVLDSTNQAPIPFATVYFDGTTNGQTTDDDGKFSLPLQGIELPALLVVSHIGYRTQSVLIEDATQRITIALGVQGQMIQTVVVQDEDRRMENLQEFRATFLGTDDWGKRAKINNEEAILFNRDRRDKKLNTTSKRFRKIVLQGNRTDGTWAEDSSYYAFEEILNLQARGKAPLEISLPDLGYTLQVDLTRFLSSYKQGKTSHLGHYFFIPAESKSGKPKAKHLRNRQFAYYNSALHFLRSLYNDQLEENGYRVYEQSRNRFGQKPQLKEIDLQPYLRKVEGEQMEIDGLAGKHLAILYYGDAKGRPLPRNKHKKKQPIQSGIFIGEDHCRIRADGTMGDSDIAFSGYIGTRGVAWILPSDYQPESLK
ncbi:MAG: carboxypeptidase-like regulatory domain-containing protein [Saprospiraceae bacterium]|nr:carboxypeptidase-like regulatory domain-containing protein [Saprospiraceae bacterium]